MDPSTRVWLLVTKNPTKLSRKNTPPSLGWREWVRLPEMTDAPIKAKIDTGARTSSLHAFKLKIVDHPDGEFARFELHPAQRSRKGSVPVEARILEYRRVRSSNGRSERRPVIATTVQIGESAFPIEVTLTSRDEMGFRMLLGRAALRHRFIVDPGRSFLNPLPEGDMP